MDEHIDPSGELRREFAEKKQELSRLRTVMNEAAKLKEEFYQQMRSGRGQLRSLAEKLRKVKGERDQLTQEVQGLKKKREGLNQEVQKKSSARKEAEEKKKELQDQAGFRGNPAAIRQQIRRLEEQIETEVMPFSREGQLRKKIKELQAVHKKLAEADEASKEANTVSADFAQKYREAEESHEAVQQKAEESQQRHQELGRIYEQVKQLRVEEQPLAEKYLEARVKYELAKQEMEQVHRRVQELAKLLHEKEEEHFSVKARKKTAEVQEKIRQRKKLSTEDILAFQALKE